MTVLIIADQPGFSRDLISRWQTERNVPAFTVVCSSVWQGNAADLDLAVVAPMPLAELSPLLDRLDTAGLVVLAVVADAAAAKAVRDKHPKVLVVLQHESWLDSTVLMASEALRRVEAMARARRAEEAIVAAQRYATLGRYMLDMRHSLNNALTSVLGHSELLLLEPGELTAEVRDQLETIRSMSLRMHEILQRFSSLDVEMQFAERQSQAETRKHVQGVSAGK
ncbi:MAG: histidine kinase dimerization/phospho-acceptor domain-containing protein [Terriglobales bacterium]